MKLAAGAVLEERRRARLWMYSPSLIISPLDGFLLTIHFAH